MSAQEEHLNFNDQFCAHNYSPLSIILSHGEGCWVSDIEGKKYLDVHSAYSGLNFGYQHPRLLKVAHEQLDKLTLTSRAFYTDQLGPFCKELAEFCNMEMVLPMNTGAEAVETAIKLARRWGEERKGVGENQSEIICFEGNFHGRTTTIVSFSDSESARKGYGPFTPGFHLAPYGDIAAVEKLLSKNTVGILVEPIQGEAGIIIPPDGFLKELRDLCSAHQILFLADEIQTGICRTGKIWCCEHEDVVPDVYIIGKSLGGGIVPISAVVSNRNILDIFTPGSHGSTFSGNPFACAIAREVLKLVGDEKPHQRAAELGEYALKRLKEHSLKSVEEVRGRGLFIGVDIKKEFGKAKKVCEALSKAGVLCKDTRDYSIRIAPPLIISKEDLDFGLDTIIKVLDKLNMP